MPPAGQGRKRRKAAAHYGRHGARAVRPPPGSGTVACLRCPVRVGVLTCDIVGVRPFRSFFHLK